MIASRRLVLDTAALQTRVADLENAVWYMRDQLDCFRRGEYAWAPVAQAPAMDATAGPRLVVSNETPGPASVGGHPGRDGEAPPTAGHA